MEARFRGVNVPTPTMSVDGSRFPNYNFASVTKGGHVGERLNLGVHKLRKVSPSSPPLQILFLTSSSFRSRPVPPG